MLVVWLPFEATRPTKARHWPFRGVVADASKAPAKTAQIHCTDGWSSVTTDLFQAQGGQAQDPTESSFWFKIPASLFISNIPSHSIVCNPEIGTPHAPTVVLCWPFESDVAEPLSLAQPPCSTCDLS